MGERNKQRGYIDLGPEWMWKVAGWLMAIGALTIVGGCSAGVYWLATHVRFA